MQYDEHYEKVLHFHGHECVGSNFGLRVGRLAVERLGRHVAGNELVAEAESTTCALDAVQVMTGCTVGNRNLVVHDNGKNAFTFWRRGGNDGVRVSAVPGSAVFRSVEIDELSGRVVAGEASQAEIDRLHRLQAKRRQNVLTAPAEEILRVEPARGSVPAIDAVRSVTACGRCGDPTFVNRLHNHRGTMMCPPCHVDAHGGTLPPDHATHEHSEGHGHGHDHAHGHAHS